MSRLHCITEDQGDDDERPFWVELHAHRDAEEARDCDDPRSMGVVPTKRLRELEARR